MNVAGFVRKRWKVLVKMASLLLIVATVFLGFSHGCSSPKKKAISLPPASKIAAESTKSASSAKSSTRVAIKAKARPRVKVRTGSATVNKPSPFGEPHGSQSGVPPANQSGMNELLEQLLSQGITIRLAESERQSQAQKLEERSESVCNCSESEEKEFLTNEELAERFKEEVRHGRVP
ncbi:MAG: hypothetical protein HYT65_02045 [Candidatus Yanofskybacteria bacterium]|nr:hypothetical protein [Candidatus Yanofskybacteria bacterium]